MRLRFRAERLEERQKLKGPFELAPLKRSIAKNVRLDKDYGLSVDKIRRAFHVDDVAVSDILKRHCI